RPGVAIVGLYDVALELANFPAASRKTDPGSVYGQSATLGLVVGHVEIDRQVARATIVRKQVVVELQNIENDRLDRVAFTHPIADARRKLDEIRARRQNFRSPRDRELSDDTQRDQGGSSDEGGRHVLQ